MGEYTTAKGWENFFSIKPLSDFEEEGSTGISTLNMDNKEPNIVYDLIGKAIMRVDSDKVPSNLPKGIYVINGKKHMVK